MFTKNQMKLTTSFAILLFGISIGVLIASEFHCGKEGGRGQITTTHDTTVRIVHHTDTIIKTQKEIVHVPINVEIPVYIDTNKSLVDYYTFKSVQDSFSGKNYKGFINDTLYMNSIFARQIRITTTQTDSLIHTTTTIRKSADGLYLGAETNLNYIGPDVMFIKGKWSYGGNIKFDPSTGFKAKELNLRANYKIFGK